ncbi:DUF3520 domain-containing protein [bacterium]|nr:MAG: DUF3520 domain-containing protein [bacterium]RIK62252.1 MAG: VWA domain-containing protein [Planctomycetota bacterium]
MQDEPHILDAALREVIGGQTPPDLIAATLARAGAGATQASPQPKAAAGADQAPIPLRRPWLRWSLAAAASVALGALVFWQAAVVSNPDEDSDAQMARQAGADLGDVRKGPEDNAGGQFDNGSGGVADNTPSAGLPGKSEPGQQPPHDRPVGRVKMGLRGVESSPELPRGEQYKNHGTNAFIDTEDDRLSTFALDVDTGSYSKARSWLQEGKLPPEEAVRAEEFVNYFKYDYPQYFDDAPFSLTLDGAPSRYGQNLKNCYLLRVGIKAREIAPSERKPATLTFVIDVSGSMEGETRLELVKKSLALLLDELREGDRVGIALFGSRGMEYLSHRDVSARAEILEAISGLKTGGATNIEEGLKIGYEMAGREFVAGRINRVILCSDGAANVGAIGPKALLETVAEQRRKGITLSSVGFGMGDYNDHLLEQLGDRGDGHYAYVDSLQEARSVFVSNLNATLQVVARDVKMQLEFDPAVVRSWRLIGYENRDVSDKDFRNDAVDGGEVGAGHSVTALYEIKLADGVSGRIANVTVRYRHDEREEFREVSGAAFTGQLAPSWELASQDLRLAANVAEFAEILRGSFWARGASLHAVLEDLQKLNRSDEQVRELIELVKKAGELK